MNHKPCEECERACQSCAVSFLASVILAVLVLLLLMCSGTQAGGCFTVIAAPTETVDGDTFKAVVQIWHNTFTVERVRVLGIDTPELHGKEAARALKAKEFSEAWLSRGEVELTTCGRDSFGRLLADVTRGESSLAVDLSKAGLAVPWEKKKEE